MAFAAERSRLSSGSGQERDRGQSRWHAALTPRRVLIAITLFAAALRFATIDVQSIWLDESATIALVHRGLSGMLSHLSSSESAPPLYYVLVWLWTKVLGSGPIAFRTFSALAGTLTIPVLYLAGRRTSARAGLWAAALAAVNPAMYYYSQEARCYMLLIFFSALAFVLWQSVLDEPTGRRLAGWAAASILAVLTHYFAAFLFVPEAIVLIRRLGWRRTTPPIAAVAFVGLALVPLAVSELGNGHKSEWIQTSSLASRIAETAKQFMVGLYSPVEIFSTAVMGLLAAGAVLLLMRRGDSRERATAADAAIVGVAALLLPLLPAIAHVLDVFDGRNVIAVWIPWAVLIAIGLGIKRSGRAGAALGVALCGASLAVVVAINAIPGYQRDNWRGAAAALPTLPSGGRAVLSEENSSLPLSIYLPGVQSLRRGALTVEEVDVVTLRNRRTGRSPSPPATVGSPPPGFRLAGITATESYAVSRFRAPRATATTVARLRQAAHIPDGEVSLQSLRPGG